MTNPGPGSSGAFLGGKPVVFSEQGCYGYDLGRNRWNKPDCDTVPLYHAGVQVGKSPKRQNEHTYFKIFLSFFFNTLFCCQISPDSYWLTGGRVRKGVAKNTVGGFSSKETFVYRAHGGGDGNGGGLTHSGVRLPVPMSSHCVVRVGETRSVTKIVKRIVLIKINKLWSNMMADIWPA